MNLRRGATKSGEKKGGGGGERKPEALAPGLGRQPKKTNNVGQFDTHTVDFFPNP